MLVRGPDPHHVRRVRDRIGRLRILVVETGVGANNHHVRPGLDPVISRGRRFCIRNGVAGIGAAGEHLHETDVARRGRLVPHPRVRPLHRVRIHAHGALFAGTILSN